MKDFIKIGSLEFDYEGREVPFYEKPQHILNHENNFKDIKNVKFSKSESEPLLLYFLNLNLDIIPHIKKDPLSLLHRKKKETVNTLSFVNSVTKCFCPFHYVKSFSSLPFFETEDLFKNIDISESPNILLQDKMRKIHIEVSGKTYRISFYIKEGKDLEDFVPQLLFKKIHLTKRKKLSFFPSIKLGRYFHIENPYYAMYGFKGSFEKISFFSDCGLDEALIQFRYDWSKDEFSLIFSSGSDKQFEDGIRFNKLLFKTPISEMTKFIGEMRSLIIPSLLIQKHVEGISYPTIKSLTGDFFGKNLRFNYTEGLKSDFGYLLEKFKGLEAFEDGERFSFIKQHDKKARNYCLHIFMKEKADLSFLKDIDSKESLLKSESKIFMDRTDIETWKLMFDSLRKGSKEKRIMWLNGRKNKGDDHGKTKTLSI